MKTIDLAKKLLAIDRRAAKTARRTGNRHMQRICIQCALAWRAEIRRLRECMLKRD